MLRTELKIVWIVQKRNSTGGRQHQVRTTSVPATLLCFLGHHPYQPIPLLNDRRAFLTPPPSPTHLPRHSHPHSPPPTPGQCSSRSITWWFHCQPLLSPAPWTLSGILPPLVPNQILPVLGSPEKAPLLPRGFPVCLTVPVTGTCYLAPLTGFL